MKLNNLRWLAIYSRYYFRDTTVEEENNKPILVIPVLPDEDMYEYKKRGEKVLEKLNKDLDLPLYTTLVLRTETSRPIETGFRAVDATGETQTYSSCVE